MEIVNGKSFINRLAPIRKGVCVPMHIILNGSEQIIYGLSKNNQSWWGWGFDFHISFFRSNHAIAAPSDIASKPLAACLPTAAAGLQHF